MCVEEGCARRHGLEWDHEDPLAHRGPTSYDNLKTRCRPHHRDKTERDRRAGLLFGPDPP
ncbi:MAG: HNH endonuclease signature motif containing protein [Nitriliruptorales bacterium]